jgi:hypothetical protein
MNSRYNLVIDAGEVIIFEGIYRRIPGNIYGPLKCDYRCEVSNSNAYNQHGRMDHQVIYVINKPIKISKDVFDNLKLNIEKIMNLTRMYIITGETLFGQKLRNKYKNQL